MDFRVSTKGVEITDAIKNYLEKRLEKVDRVIEDNVHLDIKFEKDSSEYVGKIMVHYLGKDIIVSEKSMDIYNLIDILTDSFEKKIKREKDYVRPTHKANNKGLGEIFKDEMPEGEKDEKISNVKRVNLMITSLEEAIAQMEVMNHEFFVFRNMETNEINMLLRLKNGKFILYEFQE
ncbi:30S ribosomal protein S30 [Thermosipho affectus]|uniref:30S ribosomal protein S30 n=1 Tax=Thermosipho affectus TaxID=660294 RepID=A0ABX3IK92_9BACT|nr:MULTISPECIES: ribosome-associated translation inhibitor RaiA [Thermosipho]APT71845.1 sigma 54 modulation protein / 30S ribosomal protein S30 [Thermosipho sp. 1063]ONN27624.1 30S ribosomal protein S30 [Thermosipho affectus]OOC44982.1 30S ribosomal protein S30 [Thermosipho sp. 1074]